jgi:nucleotide-binding universal stress UspA family protein
MFGPGPGHTLEAFDPQPLERLMYQKILVPVDGSSTSNQGLDEAVKLAKLTGASLRLLHVVDELVFATGFESGAVYTADMIPLMREAGETILREAKGRAEASGVKADTQLFEGMALRLCDIVVRQVQEWGADLIVIGTHGRRGVGRLLLGSDAESVLRTATVPVLLVRAVEAKDEAAALPADAALPQAA